jgi:monofunctional biosynthetic peptidoglycan transglycosylase
MAKSTRGRRAVAEQLGLLDEQQSEGSHHSSEHRGSHAAPSRSQHNKGESRPKRKARKLPSDGALLGTMIKRIFRWIVRLIGLFLVGSIALVILYRFIDPPITPLMLIRMAEGVGSAEAVGIDREWINIDDISPALLRSVIAAEDGRFFSHNGIDWKAVEEAQRRNERSNGKKLYGASTITMQCARNVFLWQGRNYIRKGLEVYFTYLMEFLWGKERILEVYVNVIEWGDGIYGAEAASQHYFNISASQLNARQAALLAAVLPNPRKWSPAQPTKYISGRASRVMKRAGGIGLGPLKEKNDDAPKRKSRKE